MKCAPLLKKILFAGIMVMAFMSGGDIPVWALPMGEKEITHFEREACRIVQELLAVKGEQLGNSFQLKLKGEKIRNFRVQEASIHFEGLSGNDRVAMADNPFDFEKLRSLKSIVVEGRLLKGDIQTFLNQELARQNPEKAIFSNVKVDFGEEKVQIEGHLSLNRIPGNPLAFLPQEPSPFQATIKVKLEGSTLVLDIIEAQVNHQPMTADLRTQVLNWLNPLWDFSRMPYPAALEELNFSSKGIFFKGHLF